MKATLLTTTTAGLAAFGFAVLPVFADDAPAAPLKPAAEAAATNTVSAYLVQVSGKGWGIAQRASLAIKTQDGVKKILLSGLRATVIMEDGKVLDKEKTTKAIVAKSLGVASFKLTDITVPESAYVLAVTGTGWADTNEKARVALEKLDGVVGAYVNRGITIHLAKAGDLDKAQIATALEPFKMTIKGVKALEGKPF